MANRRMFSLDVIDTDNFLDMPLSAQGLYFHLGMRADDDGFIASPKKITKLINASNDDLKLLIAKGYLLPFESGVVVIRHWRQNNYVKGDRYKNTIYQDEKKQLCAINNIYDFVDNMDTSGIQNGKQLEPDCNKTGTKMEPDWNQQGTKTDTQVRLGKVSIGKDRLELGKDINNIYCTELECSSSMPTEKAAITLTLNDKSEYPLFDKNIAEWKELYPNVDILQELRKMKGWLNSNPTKRKTKSGILRFVNSWLSREQDKGGYRNYGANTTYSAASNGQYQEQEPECFSDKWIREKREAAEARGETFDIEAGEYDF